MKPVYKNYVFVNYFFNNMIRHFLFNNMVGKKVDLTNTNPMSGLFLGL
jgi:hypothetical protein